MIHWYYAAAIALGTFALGVGLGFRRGYGVATMEALGAIFGTTAAKAIVDRTDPS